jgi:hypothetical protein
MTTDPTVEDDEDACPGPGECDSAYCDDRREYEVNWFLFYTATVKAHSLDEAHELVAEIGVPHGDLVLDCEEHEDLWEDLDATVEFSYNVEPVKKPS